MMAGGGATEAWARGGRCGRLVQLTVGGPDDGDRDEGVALLTLAARAEGRPGQEPPAAFILCVRVGFIFQGASWSDHPPHEGGRHLCRLRDTGTLLHAMGSPLAISIRLWELSSFAECYKGVLKKRNLFDPGIALAQG